MGLERVLWGPYLQVHTGRRTEEPLLVPVGLLSNLRVEDDDGADGAAPEEALHHLPRHPLILREVERGPEPEDVRVWRGWWSVVEREGDAGPVFAPQPHRPVALGGGLGGLLQPVSRAG